MIDDWWSFILEEVDEDDTDRYRRTDEIDDKMYIKWQDSFYDIGILDDRRLGKHKMKYLVSIIVLPGCILKRRFLEEGSVSIEPFIDD